MTEKIPKPKNRREQEEQFFAEQELAKRKALREKINAKREGREHEEKVSNWMKCPKCGEELEEICFADVVIDKCKGCRGIYLDDGELELLLEGRKAKGFISRFMESIGGSGD